MTSFNKAKAIIKLAVKDKNNFSRYQRAILALSKEEKEKGNHEMANFLKDSAIEALFVATR